MSAQSDAVLCAIAAQLDEIMAAQRLSQVALALRANGRVSRGTIERVLKAYDARVSTLVTLGHVIGAPVSVTFCAQSITHTGSID